MTFKINIQVISYDDVFWTSVFRTNTWYIRKWYVKLNLLYVLWHDMISRTQPPNGNSTKTSWPFYAISTIIAWHRHDRFQLMLWKLHDCQKPFETVWNRSQLRAKSIRAQNRHDRCFAIFAAIAQNRHDRFVLLQNHSQNWIIRYIHLFTFIYVCVGVFNIKSNQTIAYHQTITYHTVSLHCKTIIYIYIGISF